MADITTMNDIERFELEKEMEAREDYLREAYRSEAAMLAQQDEDEAQWRHEQWLASLTPEELAAHKFNLEFAKAIKHAPLTDEDVPF